MSKSKRRRQQNQRSDFATHTRAREAVHEGTLAERDEVRSWSIFNMPDGQGRLRVTDEALVESGIAPSSLSRSSDEDMAEALEFYDRFGHKHYDSALTAEQVRQWIGPRINQHQAIRELFGKAPMSGDLLGRDLPTPKEQP